VPDNYAITYYGSLYQNFREPRPEYFKAWDKLASEIAQDLLTREPPWIHNTNVFASAFSLPFSSGDDAAVNTGDYRSAAILMMLPTIEYRINSGSYTEPSEEAWYNACLSARLGGEEDSNTLRANLVQNGISAAAADFVARWSRREFNLLAGI